MKNVIPIFIINLHIFLKIISSYNKIKSREDSLKKLESIYFIIHKMWMSKRVQIRCTVIHSHLIGYLILSKVRKSFWSSLMSKLKRGELVFKTNFESGIASLISLISKEILVQSLKFLLMNMSSKFEQIPITPIFDCGSILVYLM